VPDRYWGNLLDASVFRYVGDGLVPGLAETGAVPWPWPAIAPAEFVGLAELSPGRRVMSADEAAVLGLSDNGGVVQRVYLLGPGRRDDLLFLALADAAGRIELMAVEPVSLVRTVGNVPIRRYGFIVSVESSPAAGRVVVSLAARSAARSRARSGILEAPCAVAARARTPRERAPRTPRRPSPSVHCGTSLLYMVNSVERRRRTIEP
jgi:hypothetical protein